MENEMTVNVELLERVMQHIEDHPAQHNQTEWVSECGTAACFAGWACLLSGWTVSPAFRSDTAPLMSPDSLVEDDTGNVAIDLLGIGAATAHTLFYATNTRPMLRLMVKDLVNGEALRDIEDYRREGGE